MRVHRNRPAMSRHASRPKRLLLGSAGLLVAFLAVGVLVWDAAASSRILPGVRIAGLDVGGLTREEATSLVADEVRPLGLTPVTVSAADAWWTATAESLGRVEAVDEAVDEAFAVGERLGLLGRAVLRIRGEALDEDVSVAANVDPAVVRGFVDDVAASVNAKPVDATVEYLDGQVTVRPAADGVRLRRAPAVAALEQALVGGLTSVVLPIDTTPPTETGASFGRTIVVDVSENTLVLYDGGDVLRRYRVATGAPGYPTPLGAFEVTGKAKDPTWVNPAPDGWGKDYPPSIPPGPGNPLGTRAIYLNAPGIRIHGTYNVDSIGSFASHGCVRMLISQSEELYELVDVGTPVFIVA